MAFCGYYYLFQGVDSTLLVQHREQWTVLTNTGMHASSGSIKGWGLDQLGGYQLLKKDSILKITSSYYM
jgi:hypothetical protein